MQKANQNGSQVEKDRGGVGFVIFVGDLANIWHAAEAWAGTRPREIIDGGDRSALEAARSASLFSQERTLIVESAEKTDVSWWTGIGDGISACGTIVSADAKHTKQSQKLKAHVKVVLCDKRWARAAIREQFSSRGIRLENGAATLLEAACSEDISKAKSAATICEMAGIGALGVSGAKQLLGSTRRESKIWEVCDLLLDGNIGGAIETARGIEAVPLTGNLAETLRTLLVIGEGGEAELTGMHPYVLQRRKTQMKRWGRSPIRRALHEAVKCEHLARSGAVDSAAVSARIALQLQS